MRGRASRLVNSDSPLVLGGRLMVDADGARLFDWLSDENVVIADADACRALREALPPVGEYLGGAILQAWVRAGAQGPQVCEVYWVLLGVDGGSPTRWGPRVPIRPVPPEYQYER